MSKRRVQRILEQVVFSLCAVLLAYLIVRTYVLTQWDWKYIRGPWAPREYYELGLLDEPIPSETYYPYTLIPTPTPIWQSKPAGAMPIGPEPAEMTQESSPAADNSTEESP